MRFLQLAVEAQPLAFLERDQQLLTSGQEWS